MEGHKGCVCVCVCIITAVTKHSVHAEQHHCGGVVYRTSDQKRLCTCQRSNDKWLWHPQMPSVGCGGREGAKPLTKVTMYGFCATGPGRC